MKMRAVFLLAFALLFSSSRAEEVKLPAKENFHLFILAGQSNMAGRGKVDDEGRKAHPRIFALNRQNAWQPAVDPLHWDKPAAGAGLGKPFAEIVAEKNRGVTIGLIPTACGGSPIRTWEPGGFWKQTKSHPWDDAIARAKRAMQDGTLKAILWHQGESDATAEDAVIYEEKLESLIARFRAELNVPALPFIIGQLGRFPRKPWDAHRERVHAAHQAIAKRVKNVRFVSAEGLGSIGDDLHFDTAALRAFAKGYAEAYLEMTAAPKQ
jgi:hypothetical protein